MTTKTSKMLKVSEVAKRLGVDPRTILNKIHKGDLPAIRLGGKWCMWLIDEEDFEKALESNASISQGESDG